MRSVVVVLPASMWAMIPMLRVFSREYLRGMDQLKDRGVGKKNGPLGPARTTGLLPGGRAMCSGSPFGRRFPSGCAERNRRTPDERRSTIAEVWRASADPL